MKRRMKTLIATLTLCLMLPFMMIPASANSRSPYWEGENSQGTIFMEDDIPIEVVSERLTFDIPTLPYTTYRSGEYFIEYDSKVTAEYTFYNPTDMTITAKMLFPYGELPEYANLRDKGGNSLVAAEHEKYQITVNGEAVEKTVRHSNSARFYDGSFIAETEINKISDEYLTVKNWSADTKVTKYTVKVSGISEEYLNSGERNVYPIFDVKYKESYTDPTTKVMRITDGISTYTSSMPDGNKHVHAQYIRCKITSSEQTFSFYVFGDGIPEDAVIELGYYQYNDSNVTPIDGSYEITSESTTLVNYAASTYKGDSEILFVDWVNAIISELANRYDRLYDLINRMSGLHGWYEYEITIGPGEYLTNAVTAPVYPNIDTAKNPNQYDFVYLLSPASGFASFGDLEIIINSEYVFLESNLGDFEKTEGGYKMSLDGLPKEGEDYLDLMFTMEGDVPDKQPNPNATLGFFERVGSAIVNALILVFVVIASAISWFLDLFR